MSTHRALAVRLAVALTLTPLALAQQDNPAAGKDSAPPPANLVGPGPLQVPASEAAGQPNSQGTTFVTPGMPTLGRRVSSGQVTRFTNDFNPAFSFIVDAEANVSEQENGPDGADAFLRVFELGANAWVDPNAWAYFTAVAEDEGIGVEEAAVHYTGFGNKNVVRAGRFFIDFGKQMQTHVHDLRTLERPLVLREYLGAEVAGEGAQWDSWTTFGDATVVRWSLGAFASALGEGDEDADPATTPAISLAEDAKRVDDFNYTARLTGFTEVGERGTLQLGASARAVPNFALGLDGGTIAEDLSSTVYGLDVTYGWVGETGLDSWTFGGEFLFNTGDVGAELVGADDTNPADYAVVDDSLTGFFAYGDYAWDRFNAVGVQVSQAEVVGDERTELEVYYTRMFSEFHRLRLVLGASDSDVDGSGSKLALQYTTILGAHGHGVNW
jgi:hypothetical protein